ncbi:MAG: phosphoribosylglycinamide synthetase C domain-containing protein, partial [Candidatus Cloacimonetes bacterium]|nr:phosphoribosylglycinamide synthetase C domain-containing protein [Candidatus Cloacimonadota bacterium]
IYFAGVKKQGDAILTNGGRVLCATAIGDSLQEAINRAYEMTECVQFSNQYYRTDIGQKGLKD